MRQQTAFTITAADEAILCALARFHYLTAAQASRLLYPSLRDENRYMQRRLKRLSDSAHVLRLRALPTPRYGQAPHVFTLAHRGRRYLGQLGMSVWPYFRPSEERHASENRPFMMHQLAAIDVLVAAERLCREDDVSCPRMLTERELKHDAVRVDVPPAAQRRSAGRKQVAVIPDGWFQLAVSDRTPLSVALELDRGTEDQKAWRGKVAALALWAAGPYREAFETDNLTIAVVCPDDRRRIQLATWTQHELAARELMSLLDLFLFTAASPVTLSPARFFFGAVWYLATSPAPISLLDPPVEKGGEVALFVQ